MEKDSPLTPPAPDSPQDTIAQPLSPNIPAEFLKKLAEAEDMVTKLQQQNLTQREELENIHQTLEKEARMKYRGCNHPARSKLRYRNNSQDSRLELRTSERFPPLRSMLVPRSRRSRSVGEQ